MGRRCDLVGQLNPFDHLAVAIVTASGTRVGYLGRDRAAWIAPKIDCHHGVNAIVERVEGSACPKPRSGCQR